MSHKSRILCHQPTGTRLRSTATAAAIAIAILAAPAIAAAAGIPATGTPTVGHGLMPTRTSSAAVASLSNGELRNVSGTAGSSDSGGADLLAYQGGVGGTGVMTGTPKVYAVFWGSQWGAETATTVGGSTYASFRGDPAGMAPVLQAFYAGLGTNGETWSGVPTTYCQSSALVTVRTGATSCPAGATHIGYPGGGALAGVWEDTRTAAPAAATQAQLAAEAKAAAAHFGRTGAGTSVQYVIVSPHGTAPDGFNTPNGPFCAWHDFANGQNGISAGGSTVLFTNLPYIPDAGYGCGAGYVNSGPTGALDGVTVIASHEYVETLTDPYVGYGWYNTSFGEASDVCAWAPLDENGAANLDTATGTYPVSGIWDNGANHGTGGCVLTHAVITAHTITISNPGSQSGTMATPVRPVAVVTDETAGTPTGGIASQAQATLHFRAIGLPAGLSINPTTGVITGSPRTTTAAKVTIVVTDSAGGIGIIRFTWSVRNPIAIRHIATMTSRSGHRVRLSLHASDCRGHRVRFTASGLPRGLAINHRTGVITGRIRARRATYAVTVTVSGAGAVHATTHFAWRVR